MPTTPNHVKLYETLEDIGTSVPYATEDGKDLELVICRFVSWAQMIATHPDIAARFADRGTAHIQLATDLRTAIKVSRQSHRYPNVVLPVSKYFAAKMLTALSRAVSKEPAFAEMIEHENNRWEEPLHDEPAYTEGFGYDAPMPSLLLSNGGSGLAWSFVPPNPLK